ncbi:MAG: hypothetical protein AAB403_06140 [Planctomycetota bacterium]
MGREAGTGFGVIEAIGDEAGFDAGDAAEAPVGGGFARVCAGAGAALRVAAVDVRDTIIFAI